MEHRVEQFFLVSGSHIPCDSLTLRQPTMKDLGKIGLHTYRYYLHLLTMQRIDMVRWLFPDIDEDAVESMVEKYSVLDLYSSDNRLRELLIEALSFFMCGEMLDHGVGSPFVVKANDEQIVLTDALFAKLGDYITQIACISKKETAPLKFRNAKAKEIWERHQKHKQQKAKGNLADDYDLENVYSKLMSKHSGLGVDIGELTVYQVYDQLIQVYQNWQYEVFGHRWAAWGKEDFDFASWMHPINKN